MEVADGELGSGIGARLQRARLQRGLSVEECAERLYLPASVIEALEGEHFATLGADVYARGHLRRYAGMLEMDAAALEQLMLRRLAAAPDLATIATHRIGGTPQPRSLGIVPVAIVAAVLAVAVLIWWSVRHTAERSAPVPVPVPAPAAATSMLAPAPDALPAVPTDNAAGQQGSPAPVAAPPSLPARTATPAAAPLVIATAPRRPATASTPASRRTAPTPAPAVPRETQRDYMNFDQ